MGASGIARVLLLVSLTVSLWPHRATAAQAPPAVMTERERDALRARLEDHFNELNLLIRNQTTDRNDLSKLRRDMDSLKVHERIPREDRIPELRRELAETARLHGLKITGFRQLKPTPPRPSPTDIAEAIPFIVEGRGLLKNVRAWMRSWQTEQLRLVEPEGESGSEAGWRVRARAFKFRNPPPAKPPGLRIRDPQELLPVWARKDPETFARAEPFLWSLVTRSRELEPQARPLQLIRREFQLESARMSFFLRKALPRRSGTAEQRKLQGRHSSAIRR